MTDTISAKDAAPAGADANLERRAAAFAKGEAYLHGSGVAQDHGMAVASFMDATDLGDPEAALIVALMYFLGLGVSRNLQTAREYAQRCLALDPKGPDVATAREIVTELLGTENAKRILFGEMAPSVATVEAQQAKKKTNLILLGAAGAVVIAGIAAAVLFLPSHTAAPLPLTGAQPEKIRVVVALPRTDAATYQLGDQAAPASDVAQRIQNAISGPITASGRFFVIDHQYDATIDGELSQVGNGKISPAEMKKLGQRLTADLIVVPTIEAFEYRKSAQKFHLSDRENVSYSGGFRGSVAVVNVVTGQLVMTEHYNVQIPDLVSAQNGADSDAVVDNAINGMAQSFVSALMRNTFPVSVIAMQGNAVILSQGGGMVKLGAKYQVVRMGEALVDPQTNESLGRAEQPFGTVTITRVTPKLSYADLETATPLAVKDFKPDLLEVRDEIVPAAPSPPAEPSAGAVPAAAGATAGKKSSGKSPDQDFLTDKNFLSKP